MVSNTGVNEAPRQVAVYWHLENLVSSQYNKMFGSGQWTRDKLNMARKTPEDLSMALGRARVDVKGLVGHAQSLGGLVINRVYADWSVGMFKEYRLGLSAVRPVDFVQVYRSVPVRTDIQLPIDVVADLDRYSGITDVLVCSGTVGFETVATHAEARAAGPRDRLRHRQQRVMVCGNTVYGVRRHRGDSSDAAAARSHRSRAGGAVLGRLQQDSGLQGTAVRGDRGGSEGAWIPQLLGSAAGRRAGGAS